MQTWETKVIELDTANKHAEFACPDMVWGCVQVHQVGDSSTWGAAVIRFHGSPSDDGPLFNELDTSVSLTAEGMPTVGDNGTPEYFSVYRFNLLGIRRFRAVVTTPTATTGAQVEVSFCAQNPYVH